MTQTPPRPGSQQREGVSTYNGREFRRCGLGQPLTLWHLAWEPQTGGSCRARGGLLRAGERRSGQGWRRGGPTVPHGIASMLEGLPSAIIFLAGLVERAHIEFAHLFSKSQHQCILGVVTTQPKLSDRQASCESGRGRLPLKGTLLYPTSSYKQTDFKSSAKPRYPWDLASQARWVVVMMTMVMKMKTGMSCCRCSEAGYLVNLVLIAKGITQPV